MSDERDKELDDLVSDLNQPYVHKPDELEEGEGQTCFISQDRLCQPDCTAFNVYADPKQGPERCVLLVYLASAAVHSSELVQLGLKMAKRAQTKAADEARAALAAQPIPDPFGGQG